MLARYARVHPQAAHRLFQTAPGDFRIGYSYTTSLCQQKLRNHAQVSERLDRRNLFVKAKPEFSLGVLKKYVASQDSEVLNAIYGHYQEKLTTKPAPQERVVKSMLYLLSRTGSELATNTSPEGFIEARFINELEAAGFFEEMNRQYSK
jgi:hypothetical protein